VTHCTGHMGNTFSSSGGGSDSLEGVFGDPLATTFQTSNILLVQSWVQRLRELIGLFPVAAFCYEPNVAVV
jgi:hypothetical protein